ncbi:uncharacterized protein [Dermacentor albipictus]|uniref:uncharacterized protein n=1 Tax=Dermacentor albipictus TaxID=60249 RepID=UPI0031FDC301
MEKSTKDDVRCRPTGLASNVSAETVAPPLQAPSGSSNVGRATTDHSAPTATAVAGRSRRRRNKTSSTSSSVSQANIAVRPKKPKRSSRSSRTSSSRSETAEPVALTLGGQSSTTASASSRPEDEPTSSSKNAHRATSRSGHPCTDELTREDRPGEASSVGGPRSLRATREQVVYDPRPAETGRKCSAEKSSLPGTNARTKQAPVGVGAAFPSMLQHQHSAMNRDSNLEDGRVTHRPDTAVPGPAGAPEITRGSLSTMDSRLKFQTDLGNGTGATGLTPSILELRKLEKPASEKQSLWRSLHAIVQKSPLYRETCVSVVMLGTAAGSLLLGLLIVAIFFYRANPSVVNVCGNNDCVDHVATLGLTRNDISGPCENFGRFVCSGIKNRYGSLAGSVVSQRVLDYTAKVVMQHVKNSVFSRPSELIRRCLDPNSRNDVMLRALGDFLRDKSFAWPTDNDTGAFPDADSRNYSHPLKILLDLTVTWAMPIWFHCDLLVRRDSNDRAFRLSPSIVGYAAKKFQEIVASSDLYFTYVEVTASIIFPFRKPTPAFASFVRRSKTIQEQIYNNLSFVFTSSIYEPKKVPLRDMPSFVQQLSFDDWQRVLQQVYNVRPPISRDDVVFVTNHRLLVTMCTLFKAYTPQEIAFHSVWWFAQIACILTSSVLFNAISTVQHGGHVYSTYCAIVGRNLYNVWLAAASKTDTSIRDQMRIEKCLENVRTAAVEKLDGIARIENLPDDAIQTMFTQTETIVWPNGSLASPEGLQRHYGPVHNGSDGFFGEMIATARFQQRFIGTYEGSVAAKIFVPASSRLTYYDPAQNVISVATDLLGPPFYYSSGTSAMIYGGLGFHYAMEVVIALNSMSVLIRNNLTSTPTQSLNASLWVPWTCDNRDLLFPELPALALAHAAYLRFRDVDSDLPLKGLSYSPEQIFFITFCHSTCWFYPNNTNFSPTCNEVVKNFAPFSTAFSCPEGSEMNAATKCQYL